ncbi:thiol reductant ABC exporter subunit CydD [Solwaraspora sp. WMMA2080]|uniref:thiol reductant ABC exporter subunit CydD n=1 Tax=unclassified Solwaraspora TaxID=2627926 RepID=UPI00248B006E|nr:MULTISPECIES: thiol reductant ABC exporter subunit CydD [unclassified Solwaraspora]WBB97809.1 thiol reductant ABC exporter subunit CydD [Solwaraspora sp. WMMA2059]WBC18301.1 thiol reductant ABC exporter subunit CydD [Solwaraspora sp. WMMA2080]
MSTVTAPADRAGRRRPFDPRLVRQVPAVRVRLALLGVLGVVAAGLIIAQATTLALVLAAAAGGELDRAALVGFVLAVTGRAALLWAQGYLAADAAAVVKAQLRADLLAAIHRRGPAWLSGQRAGQLATLTGRGVDALDGYFTGYLPQLVLSVTVPVAVLARLAFADWSSALIVAVTLPLIPVFGALLGWHAQAATERQWRRLAQLGGHFLDMVAGLATLRAFGRQRAQAEVVRRMADRHRVATMGTLRIAFLSGLVLELVATLAVALVAVPIGLRLLTGGMALSTALLVLLLTPEAYLPLRTAGSRFHASMEGLTVLDEALTLIGEDDPARDVSGIDPARDADGDPARDAADGAGRWAGRATPAVVGSPPAEIRFESVTVAYPRTTALRDVDLTIRAGERIAVIGPSGAGKSTLLHLLLGFVTPTAGRITVDGVDLAELDIEQWRLRLAWVPQHAHLFAASLADNIALGAPDADPDELSAAVRAAALTDVVAALPDGLATRLGERGHGLSSGQRQRVALARAFLRDAPVVLLDEPTARLDGASEAAVLAGSRQLVTGRTALIVAHRPALLDGVERVVRLDAGRITGRDLEAAAP